MYANTSGDPESTLCFRKVRLNMMHIFICQNLELINLKMAPTFNHFKMQQGFHKHEAICSSQILNRSLWLIAVSVYPKKYAHGFCFPVLCFGYTLTDFPLSIRLTSLALWQSNDCPSASKATLMNMDKYFMWIHYERLHNHNKAKHNKTVCIFLGIYCILAGHTAVAMGGCWL